MRWYVVEPGPAEAVPADELILVCILCQIFEAPHGPRSIIYF